jgi:hypothetical protein
LEAEEAPKKRASKAPAPDPVLLLVAENQKKILEILEALVDLAAS